MNRRGTWQIAALDDICEVIQGQSPPGSTYNTEGKGLPFFQGKAEFGEIFPTARKWCTAPKKVAEPGDVLISVRAPVGPTNLCRERAAIGRGLAALRPPPGMPSKYLLYALRASARELSAKATGSTFEAITGAVLRCHQIPVAPSDQQQSIVEEIEKQLTRLDASERSLVGVATKGTKYRRSVVQAALRGEFTMGADPSDWPSVTVEDVAELFEYGSSARASSHAEGVPVLGMGNIDPSGQIVLRSLKYLSAAHPDASRYELKVGDLLFNRTNSAEQVGKTAVYKGEPEQCLFASYLIRVRLTDACLPDYLSYVTNSAYGRRWIRSVVSQQVGQANVSGGKYKTFAFPLPPRDQQEVIVRTVAAAVSSVEVLLRDTEKQRVRTERLRRTLLALAFAGQLTRGS